jgi:energy-coupling factor transport system permease protein/energy-coupling factor transport system ATP-binding protein
MDGGPVRRLRASGGGAFALLVLAMREAGHLSMAMDARGFAAAHRRTWAEPAPWTATDNLLLAVATCLAALPWLLG